MKTLYNVDLERLWTAIYKYFQEHGENYTLSHKNFLRFIEDYWNQEK